MSAAPVLGTCLVAHMLGEKHWLDEAVVAQISGSIIYPVGFLAHVRVGQETVVQSALADAFCAPQMVR